MRRLILYSAAAVLVLIAISILNGSAGDPSKDEILWRHRNLGKALFESPASVSDSVAELRQAHELAPDSFRDRLNYGLALLRSGNLDEAISELEQAQKQEPDLPHTWFNLGIAYKRATRYPEAIGQFEGMIKLVPDEPVSHYNLGFLYNLTEQADLALKHFQIAAQLDPRLVAPHFQIYNWHRLHGDKEEAAKALEIFKEARSQQQAADESEDMEWCFYAELYDPITAQPATAEQSTAPKLEFISEKLSDELDPETSGLIVLDADGDDGADLLAWSSKGILQYKGGAELMPVQDLKALEGIVSVAPGDFDNDGLPDLCVLTEKAPLIYRNVGGAYESYSAKLPAGRYNKAVWLDFDHDYDNDLFLLGANSVLLRNEGDAGWRDYSEQFPFVAGRALDAAVLRVVPDMMGTDLAVSYGGRNGVIYRDRLRGVYEAVSVEAIGRGALGLTAIDVDNDSWLDLAFTSPEESESIQLALNREGEFEAAAIEGTAARSIVFADFENRGYSDLVSRGSIHRNLGRARFAEGLTPAGLLSAVAWAESDFDLDGLSDLAAVTSDGGIHLLRNRTQTEDQWLRIKLSGVKNLELCSGTEVEIRAGSHYQKKIYQGVPLVFGLGSYTETDTIRISWLNGLIQNETKEAAGRTVVYNEAPRLSGSCPIVYAWNGREFQYIAEVLGVAPLGASSGDGNYFPVDHDEYLQIPNGAIAPRDGRYEIRITEELREISYIDQARLIAVDHPVSSEIYTNDKFKSPPFPEFRLFGVARRVYPKSAVDDQGRDVLAHLLRRDREYPTEFRRNIAGVGEIHSLVLDFGPQAAQDNKAVLILHGWVDWADGSIFLNTSQQGGDGLVFPYLQVKDSSGQWQTVVEDMGMPAGAPRNIAIDLTGKFLSDSRQVRIVTSMCLYWDQIFLSEDSAEPEVRLTALDAEEADFRLRGFAEPVLHPTREQPEEFIYANWMPASMWNQTQGLYTRYGSVRDLVQTIDDRYVIMGSGDELRLRYDPSKLPDLPEGWKRDFMLLVDGWSKDGDANTAFSDTVKPLPFHGMSSYPYPENESYPSDELHERFLKEYITRPAVKFIHMLANAR